MSETSVLQDKLCLLLEQLVSRMKASAYAMKFERTRTKNPEAAKWVMTVTFGKKGKPLLIKSAVPARELTRTDKVLRVLRETPDEIWVGYQVNLDNLIVQLQASPLWVPRVAKAVLKTLNDLQTPDVTSLETDNG